jgi:phosphoglycolate phosphatase-like HAD superfamily hydrolase
MREWHESGRLLAVVSNNSAAAVDAYLDLYDLRRWVDYVSARTSSDVQLLKPSPHLLDQAITALGLTAADSTLLGDSLTDIEAAKAAGIQSIGFANKPGKRSRMVDMRADAITDSLAELATTQLR